MASVRLLGYGATLVRLTILSSGSGGNSLCVESADTCILIDAGLRKERMRDRWRRLGARPGATAKPQITAAFLTHEHADHVCGADDLAAQGIRLYTTAGTAGAASGLSARGRAQVHEIGAGTPQLHGNFSVLPVALPHDAAEPVAYVISDGKLRLGVITDCGQPTPALARFFADCDALVLETNHDRGLLLGGPYPERLKRRITSGEGHLSNEQSAALLASILAVSRIQPSLVVCAHLSKVNNRPLLAAAAVRAVLGDRATRVLVAEQDDPMVPFELVPGQLQPGVQLDLGLG